MALGIGIGGSNKSSGGGGTPSDIGLRLVNNDLADFDIADTDGNIVARFNNGHIETKNFRSEDLADERQAIEQSIADLADKLNTLRTALDNLRSEFISAIASVQNDLNNIYNTAVFASASEIGDLVVADRQSNVLVRFKDGHIETKNFRSADLLEQINQLISNYGQTTAD